VSDPWRDLASVEAKYSPKDHSVQAPLGNVIASKCRERLRAMMLGSSVSPYMPRLIGVARSNFAFGLPTRHNLSKGLHLVDELLKF